MKYLKLILIVAVANLFVSCGSKNSTQSSGNNTAPVTPTTTTNTSASTAKVATSFTLDQIHDMLYRKYLTQTSSSMSCLKNVEMNLRARSSYVIVDSSCENMGSGQIAVHSSGVVEFNDDKNYYLELRMGSGSTYYKIVNISSTYVKLSYSYDDDGTTRTVTQEFSVRDL